MTDWNREILRAFEVTTAIIRKDGSKSKPWCVYSEKTGRKFGCYKTRKEAEERLKQLEKFRHINE